MSSRFSWSTTSNCRRPLVASACLILLLFSSDLRASVSYTTPGGNYTQDFNTLPTTPTNTSLGNTPAGWTDDNASPGSNISILGWYLYHPSDFSSPPAEGGFNGHQRMRIGTGSSNTGAFWSWGAAANTERALGTLASNTLESAGAQQYIALRLTNNTGSTLGQITLTYTGEQWRDGGAAAPNAQTMSFGYAVTSSAPSNIGALSTTSISALNFTSPTFTNLTNGAALDGNATANKATKTATFGGFYWAPGQDLWLRWADTNDAGNDHGLAIDDLTFSANNAVEITSVQSGPSSSPSTWSDNQPPGPVKNYHVVNSHVVTLDAPFTGDAMFADSGTVDIGAAGSGTSFTLISVESGGNLTESVNGDVTIGTSTSTLRVNRNLIFNGFEPGAKLTLAADIAGAGDMDFQTNGAGSEVIVSRLGGHTGTVRFNGTGDTLRIKGPENFNAIEMNSTGANLLSWEPTAGGQVFGNKVTFNTAGTIDHNADIDRLQGGPITLVANAPITFDLTKTFPQSGTATANERRFLVGDDTAQLQGSAAITVNGTVAAPAGGDITRNELELGDTGTNAEPANLQNDPYSGTMTINDYANVEVRHNLANAKIVVGNNALLDMGHKVREPAKSIKIGSIEVNSGGTLEVGFEESTATVSGHHVYHLSLTKSPFRSGDLTLHSGATTVMQINGTGTVPYDTITAHGNVALAGTLSILTDAVFSSGTTGTAYAAYTPNPGDKFDLISITAAPATGDYDQNGSVGNEDYDLWRSTFGNTISAGTGADGNGNGVVDAADYVVWRGHEGQTSGIVGTISGAFDAVTFSQALPGGVGYQLNQTSTLLQLEFINAGSGSGLGGGSVPEPTALALVGLAMPVLLLRRRGHSIRRID